MKLIFQLIAGDSDCCLQHVPSDTSSELMNTRHCWQSDHALQQRSKQAEIIKSKETFPSTRQARKKTKPNFIKFS